MQFIKTLASFHSIPKSLVVFLFVGIIVFPITVINSYSQTESKHSLGDGHNMPAATLGNRQAILVFNLDPVQPQANTDLKFDFTLLDNTTGLNIPHVTYLVSIKQNDTRLFTETLHSHDGNMKVVFTPSDSPNYKINANFDGLAASYVSDFGGSIKIDGGNIFSKPGNYTAILEVTGVDFDNLFLPEPIPFEFTIKVNP